MIDAYTIANTIENDLNEIAKGAEAPFVFKIYPEVGDYKAAIKDAMRKTAPKPVVNCTLMSLPSQIVPLQNVRSYTMSQLLTVMAPLMPGVRTGTTEFEQSIEPVMNILRAFAENSAGRAGTMPDAGGASFAYVFAPQLPSVGVEANTGVGFWFAPVSLYITGTDWGNTLSQRSRSTTESLPPEMQTPTQSPSFKSLYSETAFKNLLQISFLNLLCMLFSTCLAKLSIKAVISS